MYQGVGVPVGQYTVALLYSATDPLGDVSSMSPLATTGILPVPGRFLGGVVTTPDTTPYLGTAWFAVQAWQNSFASYRAAVAGGGIYGTSSIFSLVTGGLNGNPPNPIPLLSVPGGFTGLALVPEPSTIALGVLAAAALLLRRPSKRNTGRPFERPGGPLVRRIFERVTKIVCRHEMPPPL